MAKEISGLIKLQIRGGSANPSPPVGPALGAKGVNIMEFCKQFNARTQEKAGKVLPCVITVYSDKSFDFVVKTPPAAVQLLESAKIKKGSPKPLLANSLTNKLPKFIVQRKKMGFTLPFEHWIRGKMRSDIETVLL